MIADHAVPSGTRPTVVRSPDGVEQADWSPDALVALARQLSERGREALSTLDGERLYDAWCGAADELRDPRSALRRRLDPLAAPAAGLSPPALEAALETLLRGYTGEPVRRLIERGRGTRRDPGETRSRLAVAIVAGNIPGLVVQVALPALVAGRPLLIKSPSAEPLIAPALIGALTEREPRIGEGLAAVTWPGGESPLERPLLRLAEPLIAFGHAETLADLRSRFDGQLVEMGPKLSLAVIGADADPIAAGKALAIDTALFEQRGCLSLQTIFTDGDSDALAGAVRSGLEDLALRWPPPPLEPALAGRIQQLRRLVELDGGESLDLPLRIGSVLLAPTAPPGQSLPVVPVPGGRTVRIQPIDTLDGLVDRLHSWRDAVQGVALDGASAWRLAEPLSALGVNRLVRPGELQATDALWANGERHLLDILLD